MAESKITIILIKIKG